MLVANKFRLFGNNISINTHYVRGSDSIKQESRMDTFPFIYKWPLVVICGMPYGKFVQGSYSSIRSFVHSFPDLCILLFTRRLFLHDDVHEGLSDVRRKAVEDMKKLREKSGTLKGYYCPSLAWCSFDYYHWFVFGTGNWTTTLTNSKPAAKKQRNFSCVHNKPCLFNAALKRLVAEILFWSHFPNLSSLSLLRGVFGVTEIVFGWLLCWGVGINLLYYVIWWLHPPATTGSFSLSRFNIG